MKVDGEWTEFEISKSNRIMKIIENMEERYPLQKWRKAEMENLGPLDGFTMEIDGRKILDSSEKSGSASRRGEKEEKKLPDLTRELMVTGIGHRWRMEKRKAENGQARSRLHGDVGLSHPRIYLRPPWVSLSLDGSSTKLTLEPKGEWQDFLGRLVHQRCRLRPRSAYTGHGILQSQRSYPKLKSTKTTKVSKK